MKAISNRLRRLENAAAPAERERAAVETIVEARCARLGADYEPLKFPPGWFAGSRSMADHILRARQLHVEQRVDGVRRSDPDRARTPSDNVR
jgi:hypothetical protein